MKASIPVIALFLLLCIAAAPAAALADLAVLSFDPPSGPVERTFAIPNAVENRGTTDAGPFTVTFALSSDATFTLDDTVLGTRNVPSLAAGGKTLTRSTNVTVPSSVPAGTYHLAMVVDLERAVPDANLTNNLRAALEPVTVPAPPAPDLGAGSFVVHDAVPAGTFQVDGEVANYGAAPAGAFAVGLYLSRDTAITSADTLLGTVPVPGLSAGATTSVSRQVAVPTTVPGGAYYLGMVIDDANAVAESNEANNTARSANTVAVPWTPPGIAWQRLLGGSATDEGRSVQQTADGGYVLLGHSLSGPGGNVTVPSHGGSYYGDFWLVKTDAAGAIQWQNLLGGTKDEDGWSVQQTADGGYVAFGSTNSNATGDVSGTNRGANFFDYWLVKVNSTGQKQWDRVIGGSGEDVGRSVQQTSDGGYILGGNCDSNTGLDVTDTRNGDWDIWVVKVNATGAIQWQNLLGGSSDEEIGSILQTADGGYILLGSSGSQNYEASGTAYGGFDFWVVRLNSSGGILWQKHLGGNLDDKGYAVRQTADGGYILVGESKSGANGTVTEANHGSIGSTDLWVVKLSSTGAVEWNRLLGGAGSEHGRSVQQTADGGYIVFGDSASSQTGDVTGTSHGVADYWAVNLDPAGAVRWQRLYGGSANDYASSMQRTKDGGYVLLGSSGSDRTGDVTGTSPGHTDFWLVKLNATAPPVLAVPPSTLLPTDTNGDGIYDDVNGNGRRDFNDVVLFFNQMTWIAANEPVSAFDCNGNSRIDFADVVWLFNHL